MTALRMMFLTAASVVMLMTVISGQATAAEASKSSLSNTPKWHILMFSLPGCSSCISMRQQVIDPMIEAGEIAPNQFDEVFQVSDADWHFVRGLGYRQIREIKTQYQTSLFPTLVFLDEKGNKIADNIVGMTSAEFYRKKMNTVIEKLNKK